VQTMCRNCELAKSLRVGRVCTVNPIPPGLPEVASVFFGNRRYGPITVGGTQVGVLGFPELEQKPGGSPSHSTSGFLGKILDVVKRDLCRLYINSLTQFSLYVVVY
jgi:hypothetical protein